MLSFSRQPDGTAQSAASFAPPGVDPALGVKRVFMKRFPYSVYFIELPTRFRVLAFAHAKREPLYWRGRL